ncbi:hypothetical protein [Deinococcus aerophilus]|nr:hypothetical protein [Deinococcus aerophilus]
MKVFVLMFAVRTDPAGTPAAARSAATLSAQDRSVVFFQEHL